MTLPMLAHRLAAPEMACAGKGTRRSCSSTIELLKHNAACKAQRRYMACCALPSARTEMTVMTARAPNDAPKTIPRDSLYWSARSAAMKKVLSPSSDRKMSRKPSTTPSRIGESPKRPGPQDRVQANSAAGGLESALRMLYRDTVNTTSVYDTGFCI